MEGDFWQKCCARSLWGVCVFVCFVSPAYLWVHGLKVVKKLTRAKLKLYVSLFFNSYYMCYLVAFQLFAGLNASTKQALFSPSLIAE